MITSEIGIGMKYWNLITILSICSMLLLSSLLSLMMILLFQDVINNYLNLNLY